MLSGVIGLPLAEAAALNVEDAGTGCCKLGDETNSLDNEVALDAAFIKDTDVALDGPKAALDGLVAVKDKVALRTRRLFKLVYEALKAAS